MIEDVLSGKINWHIENGDCLSILTQIPEKLIQCCVTSPPYWGLRDYGLPPTDWPEVSYSPMSGLSPVVIPPWRGCLGLEPTPDAYIGHLIEVFRKVWQVLRDDGTLWLNLGDSYVGAMAEYKDTGSFGKHSCVAKKTQTGIPGTGRIERGKLLREIGLKQKDLVGIPWRVAFALQADGWFLRSDIIWSKSNPMPESVTDRPSKAHEYIFLMSKNQRYYYNHDAIKELAVDGDPNQPRGSLATLSDGRKKLNGGRRKQDDVGDRTYDRNEPLTKRNKRTVWTVATVNFPDAHFATFPPKLIEPCILAGSKPGDIIIDPFNGAATTGIVSLRLIRLYIGIERKRQFVVMSRRRIEDDMPLFNCL